MERLNKYLAGAGVASRRQADAIIAAGRVTVNGQTVSELGAQVDSATDQVLVDGQPVRPAPEYTYLILHKPPGYLSTVRDPFGRPTVMDLLPRISSRVFPVGRLDLDTSGLLFFTNDGAMALALTHPRHLVEKVYLATVTGVPAAAELERVAAGIQLEDGPTAPARIAIETIENGNATLRLTLREGRKRQVKRMMLAIGHPVLRLHRMQMGPMQLGDIRPGEWRHPSDAELEVLRRLKTEILQR